MIQEFFLNLDWRPNNSESIPSQYNIDMYYRLIYVLCHRAISLNIDVFFFFYYIQDMAKLLDIFFDHGDFNNDESISIVDLIRPQEWDLSPYKFNSNCYQLFLLHAIVVICLEKKLMIVYHLLYSPSMYL